MNEESAPPELPAVKMPETPQKKRGFIDTSIVRTLSFGSITLCIVICVLACLLAIWDVAPGDIIWRTVATCIIISAGMMAFGVINGLYGPKE
ncbi:MAG: hypothetical protein AAFY98_03245 [Verrucomicrobiota bacterium]